MKDRDETLKALALVESVNRTSRSVLVGGTSDFKVGKYGILKSRWPELAASLGYAGASYRDEWAQDRIAGQVLERAYGQLGNWELTAIAFRFGMPLARQLLERNMVEPLDIEAAGYPEASQYLRHLRRGVPLEAPVVGRPRGEAAPPAAPRRAKSEDVVRRQLIAMRNANRRGIPAEPVSEPAVSEPAVSDANAETLPVEGQVMM